MHIANSPLRYPGGKATLSEFLSNVLVANGLEGGIYVEPYAGGAGAALNLLLSEYVEFIYINDADKCIYSFWKVVFNKTDELIKRICETHVSMDEWRRQRSIYLNYKDYGDVDIAFATFFLNRSNRSGILMKGGPIGGIEQVGKWKIDARFNKSELIRRINKISTFRDRVKIYNQDAIKFLKRYVVGSELEKSALVYLDPPYYVKGKQLYLNHYNHGDHEVLAKFLKSQESLKWIMTYDNTEPISCLYSDVIIKAFTLNYSANVVKMGSELMIYPHYLSIPEMSPVNN